MEETTFVTFESFSNNIFFYNKNEIFISLAIIRRYCPDLSEDDLEKILIKYDIKETGRFCYNDFLRYFVLTMKSHEGSSSSLLARKRLESPQIQVSRRFYYAYFCGIEYWQEYPNIELIYTVLLVAKYEHHLKYLYFNFWSVMNFFHGFFLQYYHRNLLLDIFSHCWKKNLAQLKTLWCG